MSARPHKVISHLVGVTAGRGFELISDTSHSVRRQYRETRSLYELCASFEAGKLLKGMIFLKVTEF